ncbi:ABC transporter, partial [Streptomyces sp. SID7499]|nr:ABC transporter [Streptomyces sp. SID7499]
MTVTRVSAPPSDQAAAQAITATGLRKSYGDKTVLDGIDLAVPAGSVFAL